MQQGVVNYMRQLILLAAIMAVIQLLSGCTGLKEYKWLENNTLYSSKLPSIEIKVSSHLQVDREDSLKTNIESSNHNFATTRLRTDNYVFWDKDNKQQLVILIENIYETNWYLNDIDFSSNPSILTFGEQRIGDWNFHTGIYVKSMPQQTFLVKLYGRNFGNQTRCTLLYLEEVDSAWKSSGLVLNSGQEIFLKEFDKRARDSFTLRPYSGIKPPEQRSNGVVSREQVR